MRSGACLLLLLSCSFAMAQQPFLSPSQWSLIRDEASGAAPYEDLRFLTGLHRVPGTPAFAQAARFVVGRAREYGLDDAHSEEFPIDGTRTYGLMRSYLAWTAEAGELWEVRPHHALLGDAITDPIRLADYSHSASVEAALIDVGAGTALSDYDGKDVRGKIVLAGGVLARVQQLAIAERGAVGIVSDMPNQTTAWSGLDPTLVRWGHLDARQPSGFAFMISRQAAGELRRRLAAKEEIFLNASIKASVAPGNWTVDTATIAGTDAGAGQIVLSCHLDHEKPGANDDGSGCVTILEVARTLSRLIHNQSLPRPKRTIRFVWGPEHEGTMAFLATHPEILKELRADIHMDVVGGDPFKDKAVLHVTETPWSLPSFVTDVGAALLATIQRAATEYAAGGGSPATAMVEIRSGENGTRNELWADVTPFEEGSDHDDYDTSTIAVPSLYLRDWPDIYIHTDHDRLDQIDATKLRRVAALGAAAAYIYATLDAQQLPVLLPYFTAQGEARIVRSFQRAQVLIEEAGMKPEVAWYEADNLMARSLERECAALHSAVIFAQADASADKASCDALKAQEAVLSGWLATQARRRGAQSSVAPWTSEGAARLVPVRIAPFGPIQNQNDDALIARLGRERVGAIKLLNGSTGHFGSLIDKSSLAAYEILNFVNGRRTAGEIRDAVSAEYSPLALELVVDYLQALAEAKVIAFRPTQ